MEGREKERQTESSKSLVHSAHTMSTETRILDSVKVFCVGSQATTISASPAASHRCTRAGSCNQELELGLEHRYSDMDAGFRTSIMTESRGPNPVPLTPVLSEPFEISSNINLRRNENTVSFHKITHFLLNVNILYLVKNNHSVIFLNISLYIKMENNVPLNFEPKGEEKKGYQMKISDSCHSNSCRNPREETISSFV